MNISKQIHDAKLIKWAALIKEQSESGLKIKDWCSENGISKDSYYYWKRKVKEALIDSSHDIVPVSITPSPLQVPGSNLPDNPCIRMPQDGSQGLHNLYNPHNDSDFLHISSKAVSVDIAPDASSELVTRIIEVIRHA